MDFFFYCPFCGWKLNFKHIHVINNKTYIYLKCPLCCFVPMFVIDYNIFYLDEGVYRYKDLEDRQDILNKFYYELLPQEWLNSKFFEVIKKGKCPYCEIENALVIKNVNQFYYNYRGERRKRTDVKAVCKYCMSVIMFGLFGHYNIMIDYKEDVKKEIYTPFCPFCHRPLAYLNDKYYCPICGHFVNIY